MKAEFLRAVESPEHYPPGGLPEVAFAGRSNVGKSSLINTLVNRKSLVRTSKDPGRTRQLCFFSVEERVLFVDLPGYGYAKVSKAERASWQPMVEHYLGEREPLALVLLLVDCRREPRLEERQFLDWLEERGREALVVATKVDKVGRAQLARTLRTLADHLEVGPDRVLPFSSLSGAGKAELWKAIEDRVRPRREVPPRAGARARRATRGDT